MTQNNETVTISLRHYHELLDKIENSEKAAKKILDLLENTTLSYIHLENCNYFNLRGYAKKEILTIIERNNEIVKKYYADKEKEQQKKKKKWFNF